MHAKLKYYRHLSRWPTAVITALCPVVQENSPLQEQIRRLLIKKKRKEILLAEGGNILGTSNETQIFVT